MLELCGMQSNPSLPSLPGLLWPRVLGTDSVGEGATLFPGLLHFTLDTYLVWLSAKQGGIKYHF